MEKRLVLEARIPASPQPLALDALGLKTQVATLDPGVGGNEREPSRKSQSSCGPDLSEMGTGSSTSCSRSVGYN